MAEYIVKETSYSLGNRQEAIGVETQQEVIGELIRCKDCKYYDPNDHCFLQGAEADDFCSYAERRTDGKN